MTEQLTAGSLLSAWEAGVNRRPLDRAIALLWSAGLAADIAGLPLAERDRALLGIWRSPCSLTGAPATRFEYVITAPSGGGNTFFWEDFNCTSAPDDRFVDFAFIVNADGTTEWQRDGATVLSFTPDFGSGGVRLSLHGGGFAGNIPGFSLWFDDVSVIVPNAELLSGDGMQRDTDAWAVRSGNLTSNPGDIENLQGELFDVVSPVHINPGDTAGHVAERADVEPATNPATHARLELNRLEDQVWLHKDERCTLLREPESLDQVTVPGKLIQSDIESQLAIN